MRLRRAFRKAVAVDDGKLIHGRVPGFRGANGVVVHVLEREPRELDRRLIAREVTPGFDDLAEPHVQTLDRIGGVDHAAHLRRKREEGKIWDQWRSHWLTIVG